MCVLPYKIHAAGLLHCQTFGLDGCDTLDQAATDGGDMSAAVCGDRKKKQKKLNTRLFGYGRQERLCGEGFLMTSSDGTHPGGSQNKETESGGHKQGVYRQYGQADL